MSPERRIYEFAGMTDEEVRSALAEGAAVEKPTRDDFDRLTALRAELFSRLTPPASVKRWGKGATE